MEEVNIFAYYAFGYNYYLLRNRCEGIPWFGHSESLVDRVNEFLGKLDELNLEVTKQIAIELQDMLAEAKEKDKDAVLDKAASQRVKAIIEKLDPALDAELKLKKAYLLTTKRYDLDNLLKTPENIFAKNVFARLTPLAQFDVNESLKCLAFDRPTASAFHILRATEEMVKQLYLLAIKQKRLKHPTWFPMIEELRKKKQNPISGELFAHLDMIREHFRNPTQHPEKVYDMDVAQDLLNNCITAINNLVREIEKRNKAAK